MTVSVSMKPGRMRFITGILNRKHMVSSKIKISAKRKVRLHYDWRMSIHVRKLMISNAKPFQKNPLKTKGKRNTVIMTPLWVCTCVAVLR